MQLAPLDIGPQWAILRPSLFPVHHKGSNLNVRGQQGGSKSKTMARQLKGHLPSRHSSLAHFYPPSGDDQLQALGLDFNPSLSLTLTTFEG